jgi:2-C-methyl-D-erythritol 4-phosphate cytidylyltransferase/2-C-methyl-D-erythritol 2,4-cyclodiphosphate synthase
MNIAIILAAGKSRRAGQNKLWANVCGRPLWTLAFEKFVEHDEVDKVVLVVGKNESIRFAEECQDVECEIVTGGETRMESFRRGLEAAGFSDADIVIDHNAANPNLTADEISQVIEAAKEHGAAAVSHSAVDTLIRERDGFYTELVDRTDVRLMQTPQAVRGDVLATANLVDETDLTSALLKTTKVKMIEAHAENKKVTFAEDIDAISAKSYIGEDSHRFGPIGTLKLGGAEIAGFPAMLANSDGDVILHAVGRALAQVHGKSFAEVADRMCEAGNLNSAAYLAPLLRGVAIRNLSIQIEGARPRISLHQQTIKSSLTKILGISSDQISISAMTGEDLTPFGQGHGIRCTCILTVN